MQINVAGHHVDLTPALEEYVLNKLSRLERHVDGITKGDVILTVEKSSQKAEANIHISGADIHASADSADMYAAIDALVDKLDRQLIKHKEKKVNRHHGHAR